MMEERDIRGTATALMEIIRQLIDSKDIIKPEQDVLAFSLLTYAGQLSTQLLVDINRCAIALETIAAALYFDKEQKR